MDTGTTPESDELAEVTAQLLSESPAARIMADKVFHWMKSNNIEVLGAVFKLLHKQEHFCRIEPPLTFSDYHPFHLHYYERCLRENPDGVWTESRYFAAHSLVAWFKGIWKDPSIPKRAFRELKSMLARLYHEGDEQLRTCIITGALEHLFESRDISKFFSDWKDDPVLKEAYHEANGNTRG